MPRKRKSPPDYGNRIDLATAAGNRAYGERQKTERALEAVPVEQPRSMESIVQSAQQAPEPTGGLFAPTARPEEPITGGAPFGPGPGPEVLGAPLGDDPIVDELRAVYLAYPSEALRQLIEEAE